MGSLAVPLRQWPKAAGFSSRHFFCSCCSGGVPAPSPPVLSASLSPSSASLLKIDDARFSKPSHYSPSYVLGGRRRLFSSSAFSFARAVGSRVRNVVKLEGLPPYADSAVLEESDYGPEDDTTKKSRNEKKREARRAVGWGMDLAKFSPAQIKRILRIASQEKEVFEAIMLVKRLGPDVREGRRRQFSYIGKLLRNAPPELMDQLIRAMKDGDFSKIQLLSGMEGEDEEEDDDGEEEEVVEEDDDDDDDDDDVDEHVARAARWLDGLINKDSSVINEVYSINSVNFDRQELRRLVRRVQSVRDRLCDGGEGGGDSEQPELTNSKAFLSRFLRRLARQPAGE